MNIPPLSELASSYEYDNILPERYYYTNVLWDSYEVLGKDRRFGSSCESKRKRYQ